MKLILQILIPVIVLTVGVLLAQKIADSAKPKKSKPARVILVNTKTFLCEPISHTTEVRTFGTVRGRDQARISPQVSAKIIWVSDNFRVGNYVKKDEVLVRLEPTDLEVIHANQLATIAEIESAIETEKVLAMQAESDWLASGRPMSTATDFRLRKPQLKSLYASMESAEFTLEKAARDLVRTNILAPYDGLVATRNANLGELANLQTSLGDIFASDKAEVHLSLTPEQFSIINQHLNFNSSDKTTEITVSPANSPNISRKATLVRMDPVIDTRNHVRNIIAEIEDPFNQEKGNLAVGTFVNASIKGETIEHVYKVPESAIVHDSFLWHVKDAKLDKKEVIIKYRQDGFVYCDMPVKEDPLHVVPRPLVSFKVGQKVELKDTTTTKKIDTSADKKVEKQANEKRSRK